jgi:hypothetical protein
MELLTGWWSAIAQVQYERDAIDGIAQADVLDGAMDAK